MSSAYIVCAVFTCSSALVSLGFSIAAMLAATGQAVTISRYALARSLALAIVAAVPVFRENLQWLHAVVLAMILVQALDALIGLLDRDQMKTWGPASLALINLALLIWVRA